VNRNFRACQRVNNLGHARDVPRTGDGRECEQVFCCSCKHARARAQTTSVMINREGAHFTMYFIPAIHGRSVNEDINSVRHRATSVLDAKLDRQETVASRVAKSGSLSCKLNDRTINRPSAAVSAARRRLHLTARGT